MYKITVPADRSYDAITWASETFKNKYELQISSSNWSYIFEFKDPQAATLFALKWA